jgi:hypothetical protein
MYLAEIHGKLSRDNENKEDILASNVFSFFKYANRKIFLFALIRMLGLNVSELDATQAEFRFWPTFDDHTEPDLVLLIGKYYLLFEAKYHSGFGKETLNRKHQIAREVEGGSYEAQNLGKDFKIIAVTAHYSEKPEIKRGIPAKYRDDLLWINWQSIALLINQQVEKHPGLPIETRLFANDLYELLVRKRLRNYEGVKVLSALPKALRLRTDKIFFEAKTASYRGAFLGFMATLPDPKLSQPSSIGIFWNDQKNFFEKFASEGQSIQPVGTLFFERKENEQTRDR